MSIIQVASIAGVSKSTVSRVINKLPGVAPQAEEAVRRAMDQLGYRPAMRRPGPKPVSRHGIRTGNVALLSMGNSPAERYRMPIFSTLLHGIERSLAESGLNLIMASLGGDGPTPAVVANGQADGVLLVGKWDDMPADIRAALRSVPGVWMFREYSDAAGDFDHVYYDNAAIGPLAAKYLLGRGHRRLAFLNVMPSHAAFGPRGEGFAKAASNVGATASMFISPVTADVRTEPHAYDEIVDRFLAEPERPTGVFVVADSQLSGFYNAFERRGIRLGRDLDVVGCDNERMFLDALPFRPAMIDLNIDLMSRRGVQQLLWRMQNPDEPGRVDILTRPTLVPTPAPAPPADDH